MSSSQVFQTMILNAPNVYLCFISGNLSACLSWHFTPLLLLYHLLFLFTVSFWPKVTPPATHLACTPIFHLMPIHALLVVHLPQAYKRRSHAIKIGIRILNSCHCIHALMSCHAMMSCHSVLAWILGKLPSAGCWRVRFVWCGGGPGSAHPLFVVARTTQAPPPAPPAHAWGGGGVPWAKEFSMVFDT